MLPGTFRIGLSGSRNSVAVFDRRWAIMSRRVWWCYLAVTLALLPVYFFAVGDSVQRLLFYFYGFSSVIAILVGLRVHRPAKRRQLGEPFAAAIEQKPSEKIRIRQLGTPLPNSSAPATNPPKP